MCLLRSIAHFSCLHSDLVFGATATILWLWGNQNEKGPRDPLGSWVLDHWGSEPLWQYSSFINLDLFYRPPEAGFSLKVKSLSCVRLPATPWTAAYQAPPSMGFARQECWSRLPLPSLYSSQIWEVFHWEVKFSLGWQSSLRVPTFLMKVPPPQLWHASHQDWRWGHLRIPQAFGETTSDHQPFLFQNQTFKISFHRRP